jgi:8-oxo-dGTP diphosphatase
MRFRRRPDAPSEPEPDDRAWARPEDQDIASVDPSSPEPETHADAPQEAPYEAATEPSYDEAPPEFSPEAAEEPAYEPAFEAAEEPAYEAVEVAPSEPVEEPLPPEEPPQATPDPPVRRWSGDRDKVVPAAEGTVRAAGGVVWSRWRGGFRVVVVHRPRYDDWSLPKGKAGPGESDAECALREVREETGLACSLGEELGTATYYDRHGRLKTVRYFSMEPLGGGEGPQHEVDEIRWLGLEEAKRLLSYERDVEMLDALAAKAARREEPEEPPEG